MPFSKKKLKNKLHVGRSIKCLTHIFWFFRALLQGFGLYTSYPISTQTYEHSNKRQ
jgi:hypothetical protein